MNRRLFLCVCSAALAGCNSKTRPKDYIYVPPAPEPEPQQLLPPEPTEGRLIAGHEASLGRPGTRPDEPLAPPGRWVSTAWGWAWRPDYLRDYEVVWNAIVEEIRLAVPRWEHDGPQVHTQIGPKLGTRVILLPGPIPFSGGLAAGLFLKAIWEEPDHSFVDVICLFHTHAEIRNIAPAGHSYTLYVPACEHELAHQALNQSSHPTGEINIANHILWP